MLTFDKMKKAISQQLGLYDDNEAYYPVYDEYGNFDERATEAEHSQIRAEQVEAKEILDQYRVKASGRTTFYQNCDGSMPDRDKNADSAIRQSAGYIGGEEAYRTWNFFKRKNTK